MTNNRLVIQRKDFKLLFQLLLEFELAHGLSKGLSSNQTKLILLKIKQLEFKLKDGDN